jgi:hypothetical protein
MPKLPLKDEFALHDFSVRYRAALAKRHELSAEFMGTIKGAVREQYELEQRSKQSPSLYGPALEAPKIEAPEIGGTSIESPEIKGPKIEGPKIEPPKNTRQKGMDDPEPEM